MTKRLLYTTCLSLIALTLPSCKKDDKVEDNLKNTTWVATLIDGNTSSNPPGTFGTNSNIDYYPWPECQMDDLFSFSENQFMINENNTICDQDSDLIFGKNNPKYDYDATTKKLTVGSGDDLAVFSVYELNKDRLKLGLSVVSNSGQHIVFLFKKKQ